MFGLMSSGLMLIATALYVALLVFVIVMVLRLVRAVERIAASLENKG